MKTMKRLVSTIVLPVLALTFNACSEQSPLTPDYSDTAAAKFILGKNAGDRLDRRDDSAVTYPQSASRTFHYGMGSDDTGEGYEGGNIMLPNGSAFHIEHGALTAPKGTQLDADVTITILVEKDEVNNELVFTFGPSGCQFSPAAEVWLDWTDLGSNNVKLFYIDSDGNHNEQKPDSIDRKGKRMLLRIEHFSRYALAWSR